MALTSSGDEFCARTDKALTGIPGVFKLVDDILMFGDSVEQLLDHVKAVFKRCKEHGITLSNTKYQVGSKAKFGRYVVSDKGTRPDPDKVAAISQFPMPEDLTNLRSFLGLANQLDFSPDLRHSMEPMKGLLSKKNAFVWNAARTVSMEAVKAIITDPKCLVHFNPKLKTTLLTDASRIELGYILIQTEDTNSSKRVKN